MKLKFNITAIELWFWRIGICIVLVLSLVNYWDNRQQDHLIFRTIDQMEETTKQIRELAEFDANENTVNFQNLEIITELLKRLNDK